MYFTKSDNTKYCLTYFNQLMKFSFISQGKNKLSSPKDEYNGSRLNTLEIKKFELHIEDKRGKDQEGTSEEILHNKHKDINSMKLII